MSEPEDTYGTKRRKRYQPAVGATLRPGQKGTRKLADRFGKQLLCVRYRYDERTHTRMTTVELIVSERPWSPSPNRRNRRPTALVEVRLAFHEHTLHQKVKEAGGVWDKARGVWTLRRDRAFLLGLRDRMRPVSNAATKT